MAADREVRTEFDPFFRAEFPRLVSLGTLKTGDVDIARELAQETMARAHDRWDEVGRYDQPGAWCRRVMVNLLIDRHRSRSAERRAVDRLEGEAARRSVPAPALGEWQRLVEPLPDRQRLIVTLYYGDDLSVDEIADLLDTTRGGVKASLFKARRTLRRRLEAEGDLDG